jgi:hypothetical protein
MTERATPIDARLRVLLVMLEPTFALARILGLSLDELQRLVALGYFREYKLRGLSLRQMSRYLGKSVRTIAELSKASGEAGPLLDESRWLEWQRELVRAGSMSTIDAEGAAALLPGVDREEAEEMLESLVAAGLLVAREDGRYAAATEHVNMVREDLDARLDSLRQFLGGVAHVVYRRFFRDEGGEAFARVWTFSAERAQAAAFRAQQYETMREHAIRMDGSDAADKVELSALLAVVEHPTDPRWRSRRR